MDSCRLWHFTYVMDPGIKGSCSSLLLSQIAPLNEMLKYVSERFIYIAFKENLWRIYLFFYQHKIANTSEVNPAVEKSGDSCLKCL